MNGIPYFPAFPRDWLGSTIRKLATAEQWGVYWDFLMHVYDGPDGGYFALARSSGLWYPDLDDIAEMMATHRTPVAVVRTALARLEQLGAVQRDDRGWHNPRAVRECEAMQKKHDSNVQNGQLGAVKRLENALSQAQARLKPDLPVAQASSEAVAVAVAVASAEAEAEQELPVGVPTSSSAPAADPPPALPKCPQNEIVELYHRILPELPRMRTWGPDRQANLRQRWKEDPIRQTAQAWEEFFTWIRKSDFLMGRSQPVQGKPTFTASLDWIVRPTNWAKILDGKYHKEASTMTAATWRTKKLIEGIADQAGQSAQDMIHELFHPKEKEGLQ